MTGRLLTHLVTLCLLVRIGESFEMIHCPYQESNRPVNESSFKYLCPGWNSSITDYFLYGYLGSFLPEYNGVSQLIAGAIPLAVEEVNKDPNLLPGYNLCFMNGDTGVPDTADAMRRMTEMKDSGVDAFVGLEHSCASEAFLATAWEVPLISYKCADVKVSNKTLYPVFGRTLTPSSKVSKSLIATLKYFNWKKIVIVSENTTSDYPQIEHAFREELKALSGEKDDPQIEVTETYHVPGDYMFKDKGILENIIESSRHLTRSMNEEGDYVILSVEKDEVYDHSSYQDFCTRVVTPIGTDDNWIEDPERKACRSVMILAPNYPKYDKFAKRVLQKSAEPPFRTPMYPGMTYRVPIYAGLAYDAVMLLAKGMTKVMHEAMNSSDSSTHYDPRNGTQVIEMLRTMTYASILGNQLEQIDKNGDANGSYTLLSFQSHMNDSMIKVATFAPRPDCATSSNDTSVKKLCVHDLQLLPGMSIEWITSQPLDEPKCGFQNERCGIRWETITAIVCFCSLMTVAFAFAIRHYCYEQKLACLLWKVDSKEIIMSRTSSEYTLNNLRSTINFHGIDLARIASYHPTTHYASSLEVEGVPLTSGPGFYKGNVVHIKKVDKKSVDLTRDIRKELIHVREMRHENINPFIGASVDTGNICILSLYCARGSLEDILMNEDFEQVMGDTMFVASLVADLIKGMIYLHDSSIVSHGNLKSSNCLVDSRWVLQISDYGLHEFKVGQEVNAHSEEKRLRDLLWRSPELMRMEHPPARGTQKGDVYSFAIILFEIIGRKGPWGQLDYSLEYILDRVAHPELHRNQIFRPNLKQVDYKICGPYVVKCIDDCWHEDPDCRPDFRFVNIRLKEMQSGLKPNIFDNMLAIMEKHATILEQRVKERTKELDCERKKTELLLLRMLPQSVAEQLKMGNTVDPESYDSVTIYFSDIVGFTEISASSTPLQVVDLLNDLYTLFDSIIEHRDVYKVETIGDAYMVVSGLPHRSNNHAGNIADLALRMLAEIQQFEIRHRPGERLRLRIGIHSGPCVAGVVGHKMPRYCLFGDTVNTASRMESSGEALKIHVSEACKTLLDQLGGFKLQERGFTFIKGKGYMMTYWLHSGSEDSEQLPEIRRSESEKVKGHTTNHRRQQEPLLPPATRVAKVFPYTYYSAGHIESRSRETSVTNVCPPEVKSPLNRRSSLLNRKHMCRAFSLGEGSRIETRMNGKMDLSVVSQERKHEERPEEMFFMDDELTQLAPIPRPVKPAEIMICRKVQGYSWNDLWNGINRGSNKFRANDPMKQMSVPDYC